jgi:hypothetical protein
VPADAPLDGEAPARLVPADAPLDAAVAVDAHGAGVAIAAAAAGSAAPGLAGAAIAFAEPDGRVAIRRSARTLHTACAELLAGYAAATREPWRQALLTAGCLDPQPRRSSTRRDAPPLVIEDVVQPSDVLCALWLARRCGLFAPGSPTGDAVGLRSACDIVPLFAPALGEEHRAGVGEALRANAAWRAHLRARAAVA